MKVGVLAVQGDFQAHADMLRRLGAEAVLVKQARQVGEVQGLILPGGESTTFLKFLGEEGLSAAIREAAAAGKPLFGTCAGAILLARRVEDPPQPSLGLMDVTVRRNAYGRQVSSFIARGEFHAPEEARDGQTSAGRPGGPGRSSAGSGPEQALEMVFIRAPLICELGPEVEVLARCSRSGDGPKPAQSAGLWPVFVRQGHIMATTFHPELTSDPRVHQYFLDLVAGQP